MAMVTRMVRCTRCGQVFPVYELITRTLPESYPLGDVDILSYVDKKCCPECWLPDRIEYCDADDEEEDDDEG